MTIPAPAVRQTLARLQTKLATLDSIHTDIRRRRDARSEQEVSWRPGTPAQARSSS